MIQHGATPITVLMPVYNAEAHLEEAMESILGQTHAHFEFLIIDDGSTDGSCGMLANYAKRDRRIRILRNETNHGIAFSLNRGLAAARYDLVARMDADDVSMPDRLAVQVAFMTANPHIRICSGHMDIYETGLRVKVPLTDREIRAAMLFGSPFCHPAVIMRRSACLDAGGYRTEMVPAEDLDLWVRMASMTHESCFSNLDTVLLRYRIHALYDRSAYLKMQQDKTRAIFLTQLRAMDIQQDSIDIDAHMVMAGWGHDAKKSIDDLRAWSMFIMRHNERHQFYDPDLVAALVGIKLHNAAVRFPGIPIWMKKYIPDWGKQAIKRIILAIRP